MGNETNDDKSKVRSSSRISISVHLTYTVTKGDTETGEKTTQEGTVFDYSASGVSFYTHSPLSEDDRIEIACKDLWEEKKTGTVVWCRSVKHNLFSVGASFK